MAAQPSSGPSEKSSDADVRQRLAVCLDGSWNKRSSGTNIYHIANLIRRGKIANDDGSETWRQRVYYDEGVGTGILDQVSGGAFGIGVSENVRQAYNWLVEKYNPNDEVYIFGFSRGAFTARSLVGLIAKCGLLYRGAPLPQEQLWKGYQQLGSKPEWRNDNDPDAWARRVKNREISFRPLKFFLEDVRVKPARPIPLQDPWNDTEELLKQWSRRIPIECVGIFDSVGTFGVEAIAIPWLRESRAQFHDTGLSICVKNGFHALAIDEHRANFTHIPWREPLEGGPNKNIVQRWFIGAHSNVGGGDFDNTLAQFPLEWMIRRCEDLGLKFRPLPVRLAPDPKKCVPLHSPSKPGKEAKTGYVGDSFSKFLGGMWRYALRNKPNYRWIGPPAEFENGKAIQSYEKVDGSVARIIREDQLLATDPDHCAYKPPNLWAHVEQLKQQPAPADQALLPADDEYTPETDPKNIALAKPEWSYPTNGPTLAWTIGWLIGIAAAGYLVASLFGGGRWYWLILIAPLFALAADVFECRTNHELALHPRRKDAERRRSVYLDKLLNVRLFFLVASLVGVIFLLIRLVKWLSFAVPAWEVLWLFGLGLIAVRLRASWDWSALPMAELGNRWSGWIRNKGYAARFALKPERTASDKQLEVQTSWIKRALFRDLVGFVLASTIAILLGCWLTLSLYYWVRGPLLRLDHIWGGLNLDTRCWGPAVALALLYLIFAGVENRRQAANAASEGSGGSLWNALSIGVFWLGVAGFLSAIVGLTLLQVWRLLCKAIFFLGNWMAKQGWADPPYEWQFSDIRLSYIETSLPAWLGLIAAGLACSALFSAVKQKPEPRVAGQPVAGSSTP